MTADHLQTGGLEEATIYRLAIRNRPRKVARRG